MTQRDPSDGNADRGRRDFLGKLAVAGAATTVTATGAGAMAASAAVDAQTLSDRSDARGYHLTEHIQDYYKTARG